MKTKFSRRYYCKNCDHKGRVSKDKRAKYIACRNCGKPVKCSLVKN